MVKGGIDLFSIGSQMQGRTYSWRETTDWARRNLRRYSLPSIAQLVFDEMQRSDRAKAEGIPRAPWLTMLLLKWALLDPGVKVTGAPMSLELFDKIRQRLWSIDPMRGRKAELGPYAMMRAIVHVQMEFQRSSSWGFLRWPMLLLPLEPNSRLRTRFREAFGMEPHDFIDLSQALFASLMLHNGVLNLQYLEVFRTGYGSLVDQILRTFARNVLELRQELQSDASQATRSAEEYREVPYVQRFPLVPTTAGQLRWWHEVVFARGLEDAAHIRLALGGEEYTRDFSRVFEAYVMELASELGLPGTILEDEYKARMGGGVRAVEAIVRDGDCTVLIEGKMGLFPEATLATDDAEALFRKTDRVRAAFAQTADVALALSDPAHPFYSSASGETFAIIVTSRELILGDGKRMQQLMPRPISYRSPAAAAALPLDKILIVSIESFERLVGVVRSGHAGLGDTLRRVVAAEADPRTARMFLTDHLTHLPSNRDMQPTRLQSAISESHARLASCVSATGAPEPTR